MSIYLILIIVAAIALFLTGIYTQYISPIVDSAGFCPCSARGGAAGESFCPYAAAAAQSAVGEGFCPCNARGGAAPIMGAGYEGFVGNDYQGRADYLSKKFSEPANQNKLESYALYSKTVKDGDSSEWFDLLNLKRKGVPLSSDNIYAKFVTK